MVKSKGNSSSFSDAQDSDLLLYQASENVSLVDSWTPSLLLSTCTMAKKLI